MIEDAVKMILLDVFAVFETSKSDPLALMDSALSPILAPPLALQQRLAPAAHATRAIESHGLLWHGRAVSPREEYYGCDGSATV